MFLQPKKYKYKKPHKNRLKLINYKSNQISFGNIALQSCESGFISAKQIEAARQSISRKIQRKGKIWIRIFPHLSITKKPTEIRMGKGKGQISHWSAKIKAGTILFEVSGSTIQKSILALNTGGAKFSIRTKIIKN